MRGYSAGERLEAGGSGGPWGRPLVDGGEGDRCLRVLFLGLAALPHVHLTSHPIVSFVSYHNRNLRLILANIVSSPV